MLPGQVLVPFRSFKIVLKPEGTIYEAYASRCVRQDNWMDLSRREGFEKSFGCQGLPLM